LQITGHGGCQEINYGSCWPVLLLQQTPARQLFDWTPSDKDLEFATESSGYPDVFITGPPPNAPTSISQGRWAVGLGLGSSSDVAEEGISGGVSCLREFDVTSKVESVRIEADFGSACAIRLSFEWNQPTPQRTFPTNLPVPSWTPPDNGVLDDCHDRRVIFHVDFNGRPWYEDVETGERMEFSYAGFSVKYPDGEATLIDPMEREVLSEWDLSSVTCVRRAGGVAWAIDSEEPWQAWRRAMGDELVDVLRYVLQSGRGDEGAMAPPAATTATSSTVPPLDRATLRQLDEEIAVTGADRWSLIAPGWYLSNDDGDPDGLLDELNSPGSTRDSADKFVWFLSVAHDGTALATDGWSARRTWRLDTPDGNVVWAPDEALTVWEDCSKLVVPPITPSAIDSGVETGIDPEGGLVTAHVYEPDGDASTRVVVDYRDEHCRAHPVMGPIIEHLIADATASP
jgi:hypothetical protein